MKPFPLQLEPKQSRESSRWAKRLSLDDLPRDEKWRRKKLKLYYGKLGFVEMTSTPFMFRSMAWELPSVEQLPDNIDRSTTLKLADFWQTTLRIQSSYAA
jgi:hypothetical protein